MTSLHNITLRDAIDSDLAIFFEQQRDPEANHMAAFTRRDPDDRAAFDAHWAKVRADNANILKTILVDGQVVGSLMSFLWDGQREVGYWLDKVYWGQGITTEALHLFLQEIKERPLYSAAAKDNTASLRVLQKCGFEITGGGRSFANGRGEEIDEVYLKLD